MSNLKKMHKPIYIYIYIIHYRLKGHTIQNKVTIVESDKSI